MKQDLTLKILTPHKWKYVQCEDNIKSRSEECKLPEHVNMVSEMNIISRKNSKYKEPTEGVTAVQVQEKNKPDYLKYNERRRK